MPDSLVRIASLLLAAAFAWAALAKLSGFTRWREVVVTYGLPRILAALVAPVVPLAELLVAVTLVGVSLHVGAALCIGMLSLFSIAILRARSLQGDHLPCGCFGGARKLDYRTMLSRNAFLGALSGIVLLGSGDVAPTTPSVPSSGEILPAALVLIGCALVAWIAWQATHSLGRRTDS